ncbi:hypothetical protein BJX70DRAFT_393299 [Aspergillus crustosus]
MNSAFRHRLDRQLNISHLLSLFKQGESNYSRTSRQTPQLNWHTQVNLASITAMEMRSLTRFLLARPTTTTLRQPLLPLQSLRFSSSDSIPNPNSKPTPTPETSTTATPNPNPPHQRPPPTTGAFSKLFKTSRAPVPRPTRPSWHNSTTNIKPRASKSDFDELLNQIDLSGKHRAENYHQKQAEDREKLRLQQQRNKPVLKLGPSLGRQFTVVQGQDFRRALQKLNTSLSLNKVKAQSITQKFHVRKGQMRKNNKVRRWRALFSMSFTHTVKKIQRMQKQGW